MADQSERELFEAGWRIFNTTLFCDRHECANAKIYADNYAAKEAEKHFWLDDGRLRILRDSHPQLTSDEQIHKMVDDTKVKWITERSRELSNVLLAGTEGLAWPYDPFETRAPVFLAPNTFVFRLV